MLQNCLCALDRKPAEGTAQLSALGVGGKWGEGGNVLKTSSAPVWSDERNAVAAQCPAPRFILAKPRAINESCSALGFLGDAQLPSSCSVSILLHREGRKIPFLISVFPWGVDIGGSQHLKAHTVSGGGNCIPLSRID